MKHAMILPDIQYLYIYKPASKFTEKIFQDRRLWSAKPERFNDPFDCNLEVTRGITEEGVMHAIHSRHGPRNKWPPNIATFVDSILDDNGKFTAAERARIDKEIQAWFDENKNSGVVCLSEVNDSILMWSHYAQNHCGICIEFHRTPGSSLGNPEMCAPVQYGAEYPMIDLGKMLRLRDGETQNLMMRCKAECWEYEKEWRVITNKGDNQCELVADISRVIFGLRTPDAFRTTIQGLCDAQKIRTVQATKAPMEFRIAVPK